MSDPALQWLVQAIQQNQARKALWLLDENTDAAQISQAPNSAIHLLSNRWDLAEQARKQGWNASFNDIDFSAFDDNSLDCVYYRISKEKPLVHQVFNQAWRCLKPGGQLFLAGLKNEGTKTFIDKLAKLWGCDKSMEKLGLAYVAILTKQLNYSPDQALDSSDYPQLRPIAPPDEVAELLQPLQIFSKPGQFGWNKIDQGSWLLVQHLSAFIASFAKLPTSCLDLGCGYGFLSLTTSRLAITASINTWYATDNNAAALTSASCNLAQIASPSQQVRVFADNCAASMNEKVDLIICNPPFHQGFSVESELTERFLLAAKRLLNPGGCAIFVVNQFIPLERKAKPLFRDVKTLTNNGSFKLIALHNQ